jgi:hypothetical protein
MNALVPNPAIAYSPEENNTIANSAMNNEQLQLQGTSEKFAWSAIVNRSSGKLTVTIADRMGAYVIFGQCKPAGAPSQ